MQPPEADWPAWLLVARNESGVREVPGKGMNARIKEYYKATRGAVPTDDAVPWCSAFVCWCLEQAGFTSTRSKAARSFLEYGNLVAEPRFGCIVVFSRGDPGSSSGHVGFYMGSAGDGQVWVLGGNQGNRVGVATRDMGRFLGARWPVDKLHA